LTTVGEIRSFAGILLPGADFGDAKAFLSALVKELSGVAAGVRFAAFQPVRLFMGEPVP